MSLGDFDLPGLDPRLSQGLGLRKADIRRLAGTFEHLVARIAKEQVITRGEAGKRLAEVFGKLPAEGFDRLWRLGGDIGTDKPRPISAAPGEGEREVDVEEMEGLPGDIGTDKPRGDDEL